MCVGKPKVPAVPEIPDRRAAILPDAGDPGVRAAARSKGRMSAASMIFTKQSTLGAPTVSSPSTGG